MSSLTYKKVLDLEKECIDRNLVVTNLTRMMKEVDPNYQGNELPKNLMRRVRRHLDKGGNLDDPLPPAKSSVLTLGPLCTAAGISVVSSRKFMSLFHVMSMSSDHPLNSPMIPKF